MRVPTLAVLTLPWLGFCAASTAEGTAPSEQTLVASMSQVPKCAISCILSAVEETGCLPTDPQCICVDKYEWIGKQATPCLLSSCDATSGLVTKNITEKTCNRPIRDNSGIALRSMHALSTTTLTVLAIRLGFKAFFTVQRRLAPDDWVMLVVFALSIASAVVNVKGVSYGLGLDVWTLNAQKLENFVKSFYIMEVLYLAIISLIKISLSLFYQAIFPATNIRHLLLGTAIFNALVGFISVTVAIFQCTPVKFFWKQYVDETVSGRCVNANLFAWIHAGASIAIDIWMLAIPLSQVRKLQLQWKKKVGVSIMFLLGTLFTVFSILRLQTLVTFAHSTNPTYDLVQNVLWSTIEHNVGAFCTCLPALRMILVRLAPRIFDTAWSAGRSETTSQQHNVSRGGMHKMIGFTSKTSRYEATVDDGESSDHASVQKVQV